MEENKPGALLLQKVLTFRRGIRMKHPFIMSPFKGGKQNWFCPSPNQCRVVLQQCLRECSLE